MKARILRTMRQTIKFRSDSLIIQTQGLFIESLSLESNAHKVRGDVNSDGVFNISDVVLLQKWLLAAPETNLADWQAEDLSEDGKLNVSDLCIMKHMLISVSST